jgi:hypothetical protein
MRTLWLAITLAFMAFSVATETSAQDGLKRFETDIKPQIELKSFTYGSASAQGSSGFVLNNVVAVVPGSGATGGEDTTIKIDKVTVDELDFERLKKGGNGEDMPRFMKLKMEGINGDDKLFAQLAPFGVPKVPVDFTLDYRLDTATKVLTVSKVEINLRGQARIGLALVMDGISDKASDAQGKTKDDGRLRTASLDIDDTGLLATVLPAAAKAQGSTSEAMIAMATVPVAAFTANQGPATLKALDAVVSFAQDWKKPNGPIKITIKPAKTASLQDLDKIMEPNALTDLFGLSVEYAGTRAGASGAQASAAAPPAAAPPAGGDAKLSGPEAAMSIVGNTLAGKYDGGLTHEHYNKDGTSVFLDDDGSKSKGKWSIEGQKICTKYKGDDKDCYGIERAGDAVTLTDAKGKAYKLKVLPGNPKDL